jgi:hypothetical protein
VLCNYAMSWIVDCADCVVLTSLLMLIMQLLSHAKRRSSET